MLPNLFLSYVSLTMHELEEDGRDVGPMASFSTRVTVTVHALIVYFGTFF